MNQLAALLRDFAQGASNSAASNVTAPVDALAWLLRKGGLPIPENPVGGSDWARQRGLTAEPQNKLVGLLGDAAGMAVPLAAVTKAPQIARGLLQMGDNLAAPATNNKQLGAVVWHGSPHQFNAFDSSKIGTGEGAQAYGHGLYLAEHPATADNYRKTLTHPDDYVNGKLLDSSIPEHFLARVLSDESGNVNAAKDSLLILSRPGGSKSVADSAKQALQLLESGKRPTLQTIKPEGSLYKVDLPDNAIAKMLDWDKPLSQQAPEVQKIIKQSDFYKQAKEYQKATGASYNDPAQKTGEGLLKYMRAGTTDTIGDMGAWSNGKTAEQYLKDAGIPGIRYLDQGSRAGGTGTSNFVVFPGNEGLLKILERNGKPLP